MKKNIVLIGLPGSGKTTVGSLLAEKLGRKLVDTDALVEQREGCSIPQIFAQKSEQYFRDAETACARQAAAMEGVVIATGGGLVLRPENMAALKKTGVVYFLDRTPEDIAGSVDVSDRPLLKDDREKIYRLHEQRDPLYRKYAAAVLSGGTPGELADTIALLFSMTE